MLLGKNSRKHEIAGPKKGETKSVTYTMVDQGDLTSVVNCDITNKDGKFSFDISTRVYYSYSYTKFNIILKDLGGIKEGKSSVTVIDKNSADKVVLSESGENITIDKGLEYNGKLIYGTVRISKNDLTPIDGKYFIQVKTTDHNGMEGSWMAKFSVTKEGEEADKNPPAENTAENIIKINNTSKTNSSKKNKSSKSKSSKKKKKKKSSGSKSSSKTEEDEDPDDPDDPDEPGDTLDKEEQARLRKLVQAKKWQKEQKKEKLKKAAAKKKKERLKKAADAKQKRINSDKKEQKSSKKSKTGLTKKQKEFYKKQSEDLKKSLKKSLDNFVEKQHAKYKNKK